MISIFLSYRRADTQATAGRIAQFLRTVPAVRKVFYDEVDIPIGERFDEHIDKVLARATHVFILMGPQWQGPVTKSGRTRLFDEDDIVRHEAVAALMSRAKVVPILLDSTSMPGAEELPPSLSSLSRLNAFRLRTETFTRDMDSLLDAVLSGKETRGSRWLVPRMRPLQLARRAAFGAGLGALLLLLAGIANRQLSTSCYDLVCSLKTTLRLGTESEALSLLWLIVVVVLTVSALLPIAYQMWRQRRQ